MSHTLISGLQLLVDRSWLRDHSLVLAAGKILAILPNSAVRDVSPSQHLRFPSSHYCVPGLIDLHIHGAKGFDFMDGTKEAVYAIDSALAAEGVTSYLATTLTQTSPKLEQCLAVLADVKQEQSCGLAGIHLEGPFLAPARSGAQASHLLCEPNLPQFKQWQRIAQSQIKLVTLAPELTQAAELIHYLNAENIVAGYGHSAATYAETKAIGGRYATHLFNAMSAIHHREPGIAMQLLLDDRVYAEVIADGQHLHPAMLELALRVKTKDRLLLVSDAMRAKCMPDGHYDLGGLPVTVTEGRAALIDGTLAGSTLTLPQAILNMTKFTGCSLIDAIEMATLTPAKAIGLAEHKALLAENYAADLVILDAGFNVQMTIRAGKPVYVGAHFKQAHAPSPAWQ